MQRGPYTKRRKYSIEDLKTAVEQSLSINETLKRLKISGGGNYATIKRMIAKIGINTAHFKRVSWSKGKCGLKSKTTTPLINLLCLSDRYYQSNKLRKRLLKEGVFNHICFSCHHSEWMDGPIPLELDHINGNNMDNRIENLRLLCPNCHALTPTYRGKNI